MSARAAATQATRERVVAAAVELFFSRWYDEVTLRDVADRAGVALQTVRNHFGSKEELFAAAGEAWGRSIGSARWVVAPGDVDGAVATIVEDYERTGDATIRMLSVEPRLPVVRPLVAVGRQGHRDWCEHVFPAALAGLAGGARERRLLQLVVALDVYAWKLLRRDRGLSRHETFTAMRELVLALHPHD